MPFAEWLIHFFGDPFQSYPIGKFLFAMYTYKLSTTHWIFFRRPWLIILSVFFLLAAWLLSACTVPLNFLQTSGGVLFQDDFSHPIAKWKRAYSLQASSDYVDGFYSIAINQPHLRAVSTPGLYFDNVQIEVDTQKVSGAEHNLYGAVCRYRDDANYYALLISSDGYYGIFANINGKFGLIGVELMQASNAIHPSPAFNHLSASCNGDQLSLAVNGVTLTTQTDKQLSQGDIGLLVGSLEEDGVEVWFDNLSIIKP